MSNTLIKAKEICWRFLLGTLLKVLWDSVTFQLNFAYSNQEVVWKLLIGVQHKINVKSSPSFSFSTDLSKERFHDFPSKVSLIFVMFLYLRTLVFWDVSLWSVVDRRRRFEVPQCLHPQRHGLNTVDDAGIMVIRNVRDYEPGNTEVHPRRPQTLQHQRWWNLNSRVFLLAVDILTWCDLKGDSSCFSRLQHRVDGVGGI